MTSTANPQQRNYFSFGLLILAALPFVETVGVLPAFLAVLLAWGSRQIHGTRQYAMYSSIYAGVSVFFLPPFDFPAVFFDRLALFFLVVALGFFLGSALDGVQDGTFWAWLAPLVLFFAFPSAWGAVAVLGLALLAALEKQKGVLGNKLYLLESQHLWRLGTVILLLAALGFFLPRVGNFRDPTPASSASVAPVIAKPQEKPPEITAKGQNTSIPPNFDRTNQIQDGLVASSTALLFVLVVVLAVFLLRSKLEQRKNKPNKSFWDFMPVIAVLILAVAILLLALNAPPYTAGKLEQEISISLDQITPQNADAAIPDPPKSTPDPKEGLASWLPFVMGALALLLLYWLYRRASQQFALTPEPEPEFIPNPVPSQAATNRVRQAYLDFLELSTRRGLPRMSAETPLEFVGRFAAEFPQSREAAQTLTELYEPVRYGRLAAETHARAAEVALTEITRN